jgi:hypothetical protein
VDVKKDSVENLEGRARLSRSVPNRTDSRCKKLKRLICVRGRASGCRHKKPSWAIGFVYCEIPAFTADQVAAAGSALHDEDIPVHLPMDLGVTIA